MFRFLLPVLLTAGVCLVFTGGAFAGSPSKGLKIEPMLKQAIIDTATPEEADEPPETIEPDIPEQAEPSPVTEEAEDISAADEPLFPAYVGLVEEEKPVFEWPEEPGSMFGGIKFLPSLLAKLGHTDNVFATDRAREGDIFAQFMPRLQVTIPDIRHEVTFDGSYEMRAYASNPEENQHNLEGRLYGALHAANGISVPFDFDYHKRHEEREDDLTQQLSREPLSIKDFEAESGLQYKPGSFGVALLGRYKTSRNDDGQSRNGASIIRRDADHDVTEIEFNTSFDLDPQNTLMLWGTVGDRDYQKPSFQAGAFNGPRRDSDTFAGMMSWLFDYTGLKGHMSLGIQDMNYDDTAINDIREIVGDMEIEHQVTDLTSVNFQLERSVFEDAEVIEPIIRSRAGLYVDQQLWEEVLVAAGADYNFLEFNNSGRDDETWDFRLIADYFFNDFLAFGAEYVYTLRDSEQAGLDFDRNVFMLRARGRL